MRPKGILRITTAATIASAKVTATMIGRLKSTFVSASWLKSGFVTWR